MRALLLLAAALFLAPFAPGQESKTFTRKEDVIYGRKYGVALTLDVLTPKQNANGIGLVNVLSGGWYSQHQKDGGAARIQPLLDRGYTIFSVVHGSQPKFSIPEIFEDMNRAVRFIRAHAADYKIDPDHIGITGGSAGGHLSLLQGMAGGPGKPDAPDPIDRLSSRVQAVACFYPPTDFLNYGKPDENAVGQGILWNFSGAFGFQDYDPDWRKLVPITDPAKINEIGRNISPISHVTPDDPPTLIIHGDHDWLVPIQQSETFIKKLQAAGVEAKLVVKPGAEHGWKDMAPDWALIGDWFDAHLKAKQ
jgi:acetyl esterase/lipase